MQTYLSISLIELEDTQGGKIQFNQWLSPPGSFVHRILQVRMLEWPGIPFSWGTPGPRNLIQVYCIADRFLPCEPPWNAYPSHTKYIKTGN